MVSIKRVAYGFNSVLEAAGEAAYFLDAIAQEDEELLVDVHQSFKTKAAFLAAVEGILPLLGGSEDD